MNPIQDQFVKQILHQCVDLGWNAKELCDVAGIAQSTWSEIRSGTKSPSLLSMHKIARAVGLDLTLTITKPKPK